MSRSSPNKPLRWSELAVLAMLGGLILFGLAAQGLSPTKFLVSIGFGSEVLLLTWLWDITLRQKPRPPTAWQRVWGWVVFVAWLAVLAGVVWYYAGRPWVT
jgi:hypothetical protein